MQHEYDIDLLAMRRETSLAAQGNENRLILLVPNTDRDLLDFIFEVVRDVGVSIDPVMPDGIDDNNIMQLACLAHWGIAFLIVNNIGYSDDGRLQDGAIHLIHNLSRLAKPIEAGYGWPTDDAFAKDFINIKGPVLDIDT